jgi:hypothetical protein
MPKKLPKPTFAELVAQYRTDPESVHDCPRIYKKDPKPNVNTCAIRITEGLVLALGLIESRTKIGALTKGGGDGKSFLLGPYGYKANLCPHGIGRGAKDVAEFLREHWGKPTFEVDQVTNAARAALLADPTKTDADLVPPEIVGKTGAIAFIKIDGYGGQGHMDVWNQSRAVGSAYFRCRKVWFWQLE